MQKTRIHSSKQIFDHNHLRKRQQKAHKQKQLQKKLQHAISECFSSYLKSQIQLKRKQSIEKSKSKNYLKANSELKRDNQIDKFLQKDIQVGKKCQIEQRINEMTENVKEDMYNFVCQILEVFKSKDQKNKKVQNYECNSCKDELSQSNKNFLIELLTRLDLLEFYKGVDRSFQKLVNEAQWVYYNLHNLIQRKWRTNLVQNYQQHDILVQKNEQMAQMDKYENDTERKIASMRKNLQVAQKNNLKMKFSLESCQNVCGYDILQESTMGQFQQKQTNSDLDPETTSLSSDLYFKEVNKDQENKKDIEKQQQSCLLSSRSDKIHEQFVKIVSNWKKSLRNQSQKQFDWT